MKIYIGSDHGAFELKELLREYLVESGHEVLDEGCYSLDSVDYPDIAKKVSNKVLADVGSKGILLCGTGLGMMMTANKVKGIRAALCSDEYSARMSQEHNRAQVLCLGGRVIGSELAKSIADTFINTEFSGLERHQNRINMME